MNYVRVMGASLTMPLLWLLVSGCHSIEKATPERTTSATTTQVISTNPVPFEIEDDHVFVRGSLNGHEVRFGLDTGASHVLVSPEAAAAAGIQKMAKIRFGAFGDGRGSARKAVADSVTVGPASAKKVPLAIMAIPPPFKDDGLLGLSFLGQFTFRLDYELKQVSFAPPASDRLMGAGSIIPLQGEDFFVVVRAEVDGIPAKLLLDSGSSQALILRSWFVEEQKLRERYPNRLSMITGAGLLGRTHGEITRLQTLKLGNYTITNLFTEFETKPDAWPGDFAGFVGAPILCRFNLTFDVTGRRLWIEPNANYAMESTPPASVRSGLVCLPEGANWVVEDLIAGSPAVEAGVRRGDRLLEIDGVSVQSMTPGEIKRAFRVEPGTHVRLRLQTRQETPREVTLILRDLL